MFLVRLQHTPAAHAFLHTARAIAAVVITQGRFPDGRRRSFEGNLARAGFVKDRLSAGDDLFVVLLALDLAAVMCLEIVEALRP